MPTTVDVERVEEPTGGTPPPSYLSRLRDRWDGTLTFLVAVIAVSWAVAIAVEVSGLAPGLRHHELSDGVLAGDTAWYVAAGLSGLAWVLMTGAMMLPSSIPMVHVFSRSVRTAPRRRTVLAVFLSAYFLIWTAFGVVALFGDLAVHRLEESWSWLAAHPQVIPAITFGLAAVWQLTPLKDACLKACRHPLAFMIRHYRRGVGPAFELGMRHGVFCLGCCWAMMLVMFAAGVANLAWMGVLAVVMVIEKALPDGDKLAPAFGGMFALAAILSLTLPSIYA